MELLSGQLQSQLNPVVFYFSCILELSRKYFFFFKSNQFLGITPDQLNRISRHQWFFFSGALQVIIMDNHIEMWFWSLATQTLIPWSQDGHPSIYPPICLDDSMGSSIPSLLNQNLHFKKIPRRRVCTVKDWEALVWPPWVGSIYHCSVIWSC